MHTSVHLLTKNCMKLLPLKHKAELYATRRVPQPHILTSVSLSTTYQCYVKIKMPNTKCEFALFSLEFSSVQLSSGLINVILSVLLFS